MNADITTIVFGPPGTGKTTHLLARAEGLMAGGIKAKDICFVTFTRRGAAEAKGRAMDKFKLNDDDLRWWRTLHSLAFYQLGLSKRQVMGVSDYLRICNDLGLHITIAKQEESGRIQAHTHGDRLFFMEGMARATLVPLKEYWEYSDLSEDITWWELELLERALLAYKAEHNKHDYTDLLQLFNAQPVAPDTEALFIDEAQDLTPLQWQVVEHLAAKTKRIFVAGDDDQAIFKWAGADAAKLIHLPGERMILPQSYRVPRAIQGLAERVILRVNERVAKHWEPTALEGTIDWVPEVEGIDMAEGTWLLLARNNFLLHEYHDYCIRQGYVFDSCLGSPVRDKSLQAIVAWEALRAGKSISALEAKLIYGLMSPRERVAWGFKGKIDAVPDSTLLMQEDLLRDYGLLTRAIWHEALDMLDMIEREYFIAALRRGEKLKRTPRIRINTIHGVKGAEADHVVLQTDMAPRTWREYELEPDDEHRVWYVAITRARQTLQIISPRTDKFYDL